MVVISPGLSAVSEGKMVTNTTLKVSDSEKIAQKRESQGRLKLVT
jgi:hypothetical protein